MLYFDYARHIEDDLFYILGERLPALMRIRTIFAPDDENLFSDIAIAIYEYFIGLDCLLYDVNQEEIIKNYGRG